MPINFSDLVAKVEAQNAQNRQQLVSQIMPAIDVMVKRRQYDYENEQAAASMASIAQQNDIPFTPIPGADQGAQTLAFNMAVGKKAMMMHEKTHESIRTIRPLKDGVIADFNAAELMIRELMKMI